MFVTVEQAKKHLNIDSSYKDDDEYISQLIEVSENAVEQHLDIALQDELQEDGQLPPPIIQSVLLLVGNLYANREPVSYASVYRVPYSFDYLLGLYKKYYIP